MFSQNQWNLILTLSVVTLLATCAVNQQRTPMQALAAATPAQAPPQVAGCDIFPADNIWNTPVDTLPVHSNSYVFVATIGASRDVHPDFGAGIWEGRPIGIPYVDVPAEQAGVAVSFTYANESDLGPYPIPTGAPIEGGPDSDGDRHVLVLERDNCLLYELFDAYPQADGSWQAGSGAIFDLNSHALRPAGWTSADAAGLPILPGLVRYDEVAAGEIRHALRFTAPQTRREYIWPARHFASQLTGTEYPPMGQRFRLKADFDISGFSPQVQVILRALKRYGMILTDNGSAWYLSGAPDERWNNDLLRQLKQVHGSNFEAVDVSSLKAEPNSGRVRTAESFLYLPLARKDGPALLSTMTPTATTTPTPTTAVTPSPTATVIAVDLFVDDSNTTGVEDGSTQHPYNTVQEAIDAGASGQIIAVAAGTYAQNLRVQDKTLHLYGGYLGGTPAEYASGAGGNFSQRNPTANLTHLLGNGMDSTLSLLDAGASTVDGFRITGGSRSLEGLPWTNLGGGVYLSGGSPVISHNVIEQNDTLMAASPENESVGGGIYSVNAGVSILNNTIRNNISGRGAGIAINGGTILIRGNTVQGNVGVSDHGGGLFIWSPNAQISHNRIVNNEIGRALEYGWGGGITVYGEGASVILSYNVITGNYAPSVGSGVFIDDGAEAVLHHELIYDNQCTKVGGAAIYVDGYGELGSTLSVIHSTVASHNCTGDVGGNGLYVEAYSGVTIRNSIFWGNGGGDFSVDATSKLTVTYSISGESMPGSGDLSVDPRFADPANHDYHLRSTGGRWDPTANGGSGGWIVDSQHSPAIDAGNPASDFAQEPLPNGGRANLGAYGNTAEASKAKPARLFTSLPLHPTPQESPGWQGRR
jgi:hypothetical protein